MNENVSFGFRLATESDTLHSSHQTLGLNDKSGSNEDFGLDQAYIMVQHKGANAWAGKNEFPLWNLGDLLWDGDIQPEGFSAGYKTSYKNTKFTFSLSEFVVNESNWGEDDNIIAYQLKIDTGSDAIGVSIAGGALSFFEGEKGNPDAPALLEQDSTLAHVLAEFKLKKVALTPRFGIGWTGSSISDNQLSGTIKSSDDSGFMIFGRAKLKAGGDTVKLTGLRLYYFDLGIASQPGLGELGADNFPFASNYRGWRAQVDFKLFKAISADVRYYYQTTKNEDLVDLNSSAMEGDRARQRIQVNLNVKF